MKNYFFFIFIITLIFFIIDYKTNKHFKDINKKSLFDKYIILCLSYFHLFLFFHAGFFLFYLITYDVSSNFLLLHLLILMFVILHWNYFDDKCIVTIIQNNLLGISHNEGFRDIYDILTNSYTFNSYTENKRDYIYRSILMILIISILTILYNKNANDIF